MTSPSPEQNLRDEVPIGVSQWLAYGEKYGYADFFRQKERESLLDSLEKEVESMKVDVPNIPVEQWQSRGWEEIKARQHNDDVDALLEVIRRRKS